MKDCAECWVTYESGLGYLTEISDWVVGWITKESWLSFNKYTLLGSFYVIQFANFITPIFFSIFIFFIMYILSCCINYRIIALVYKDNSSSTLMCKLDKVWAADSKSVFSFLQHVHFLR
jgi:hypothetical protein